MFLSLRRLLRSKGCPACPACPDFTSGTGNDYEQTTLQPLDRPAALRRHPELVEGPACLDFRAGSGVTCKFISVGFYPYYCNFIRFFLVLLDKHRYIPRTIDSHGPK